MQVVVNTFIFFILFITQILARDYNTVFSSNGFNITSLMNAVYQDDYEATKVFLKSGAEVNEKNIAGVSPLHISAKNDSIKSMEILIEYGANLDIRDTEMWTPLMRACLSKHPRSASILIEHGANVWLKNIFGETALIHSVMSNCVECIRIINDYVEISDYETNDVINEINKSLNIAYKKENTEIEGILNEIYNKVTNKKTTINTEKEKEKIKEKIKGLEKERRKQEKENKENDNANLRIKKEIEYLINKIYIFQGETRYINKNNK